MPVQDMDPLFALVGGTARNPQLAVCPGYAAPLNSGWMALAPSCATYAALRALVLGWPSLQWSARRGWGVEDIEWEQLPAGGVVHTDWTFHSAKIDQGLWYYYFRYVARSMLQIFNDHARLYRPSGARGEGGGGAGAADEYERLATPTVGGLLRAPGLAAGGFPCLRAPNRAYEHWTGHSKPWMKAGVDAASLEWQRRLDALNVTGGVPAAQLHMLDFSSPLGYHAANK